MQRIIPLKPASQEETAASLLEEWRASLQDHYRRRCIIGSSWFLVSRWEKSFTSPSHEYQARDH